MKLAIVAGNGMHGVHHKGVAQGPHTPRTRTLTAEAQGGERDRILLEELPLVHRLARRIHMKLPHHVDIEDLVSAGVLGLMDAFSKFDPGKKVLFRSYAQLRIRGAILDSLRTLDWSPRCLRRQGRAMEEASRVVAQRDGCLPGDGDVASEMGLGLKEYQILLAKLKNLEIGTLQLERGDESGEDELAQLPSRQEDDPLSMCMKGQLKDRLALAIADLPDRERLVSTLYYYLEKTMQEIALTLGVAESGVSKIHSSAVAHLRTMLKDLPGPQVVAGETAHRKATRASGKKESGLRLAA